MMRTLFATLLLTCGSTWVGAQPVPELTRLAQQTMITTDPSCEVSFGRPLNVRLHLPRELGGSAITLPPVEESCVSPVMAFAKSSKNLPKAAPGKNKFTTPIAGDLPCNLLPGGCPGPISLPGGTILSNFTVSVAWNVQAFRGNQTVGIDPSLYRTNAAEAAKALAPTFTFAPLHIVDYTGAEPIADKYQLVASVMISALQSGGTLTSPVPVSGETVTKTAPFNMKPLQVPTVFVLYKDQANKISGNSAAIYLPQGSQVSEAALQNTGRLFTTYNAVRDSLSFVTWFGDFVTDLGNLSKVFSLPGFDVKERKYFENDLNEDNFVHYPNWPNVTNVFVNDVEVEDESTALLFIAPPCTGLSLWQHDSYKGKSLELRSDAYLSVLINDLNKLDEARPRQVLTKHGYGASANDSLSSFKWALRKSETNLARCSSLPPVN